VSEGVLTTLERTTEHVRWTDMPTDGETQYVIFSRSGYTEDLKRKAAERNDVKLFTLDEILYG